ncbi:MAG: 6-phospho-beta-glucosidase, partial [Candidatus Omnitrophica bacterium]|nr:6-phospho-beta-glucosidase [Candidatus Omnitrophota bacterium]
MVKVAVIGGGSSYTPELLEGLLERRSSLNLDRICLMDIDSQRLQILSSLGERMAAKTGADIRIESTTQPDQAIDGADYVITQFRVGGMAARIRDEKLGLRNHIIGQETTGIGGFAKALRTIPAILNIAAIIEKRAPQAWLVNFTNPAGIITESVLKHSSVRVVGLCNIPIGYIMAAAKAFSVSPSSIELDYAGLNHLSWVRGCRVDGIDRFPEFLEIIAGEFEEEEKPSSRAMAMWTRFLGVVPNYYFAYYFCTA